MNTGESLPPSHRRNRNRNRFGSAVGSAVTTALAVYGAYQLAVWAWTTWNDTTDESNHETNDETNDDMKDDMYHCDNDRNQNVEIKSQTHRRRMEQNHETSNRQRQTQQRQRRRYVTQCQRQTATTLAALSSIVLQKIEAATDTTLYRSQLKEIRKLHSDDTKHHESILWMSIQVETVTRCMTMAYAYTLFFVTLTVQVHGMGGELLRNSTMADIKEAELKLCSDGSHDGDITDALTQWYDAFLDRDGGLDDLISCVRSAVQTALKDWNIHDPIYALQMKVNHVQEAIAHIRSEVERINGDFVTRFMIHRTDANDVTPDDLNFNANRNVEHLTHHPSNTTTPFQNSNHSNDSNDTLRTEVFDCDLLESPMVRDAMQDAVQCVFTILDEHFVTQMFSAHQTDTTTTILSELPLPQVIAQFKVTTRSFLPMDCTTNRQGKNNSTRSGGSIDSYLRAMEQLPSIQAVAMMSFDSDMLVQKQSKET
jgi:hypothetical protein